MNGGGNYTSASTYGSYVNGTGDSQFARTFDLSGPYANRAGAEYVGAQGQWSHQPNTPTAQNLALIQKAGSVGRKGQPAFMRNYRAKQNANQYPNRQLEPNTYSNQSAGKPRKSRRGGFIGEVINQAIVPFGLLGLQQTYRKKRTGGRKTRRHRRR
jgi:hypothetical protein